MQKNKCFLPAGVKLGVSPLSWTNEDVEEFGKDIPLEVCLQEASAAGFEGIELGRKFPREAAALGRVLGSHNLELISGWYSGLLADPHRTVAQEMNAVAGHARLLAEMGATVMVYGECGSRLGNSPFDAPMSGRMRLEDEPLQAYARRLDEFSLRLAGDYGLTLAYHHHLMMVTETWDEVSRLFELAPAAGLLLDTGHAFAAGFDYTQMIHRFADRIVHLHLKDVRGDVLQQVRSKDMAFNAAVRAGLFTVPGDGSVNFSPLFDFVRNSNYRGWMVVEAEQDPTVAVPGPTVARAFRFVQDGICRQAAIA